ncbi:hypothetical protein RvY_08313-2 [Ramazzottius varieornatus]|uniref:Uncharacterized protein n=1 Tax=Ramazzottius varieornatus TaxID=947166 RepID=A0A1D1VEL9_RAMVA|nr:hypothetical protein RvY_08313-2 [Ramazzottius varieornatus]
MIAMSILTLDLWSVAGYRTVNAGLVLRLTFSCSKVGKRRHQPSITSDNGKRMPTTTAVHRAYDILYLHRKGLQSTNMTLCPFYLKLNFNGSILSRGDLSACFL